MISRLGELHSRMRISGGRGKQVAVCRPVAKGFLRGLAVHSTK